MVAGLVGARGPTAGRAQGTVGEAPGPKWQRAPAPTPHPRMAVLGVPEAAPRARRCPATPTTVQVDQLALV